MKSVNRVVSDPSLLAMSRQALINDRHCATDASDGTVAALVFEQVYLARLTNAVQTHGSFWGGRDAVLATQCKWGRAAQLLTRERVHTLEADGLVVIDGALSAAEVAAARAEVQRLDAAGQLEEVECQSKARIRNDRIGWLTQQSERELPALCLVARLLRGLPAEVERHASDAAPWGALRVPRTVMAAVYGGSPAAPTYYCKHYDGGGKGNPRKLTAICYLNDGWDVERDGGALRAYLPSARATGAYVDVVPQAGRVLLFDSVTVEHEVRPTFATRCAVTLWVSGDADAESRPR